ncbi:MAG: SDR family oxidoreductase [Opitutales bacterium]
MKILLTGASGLLGSAYATAAVRRGHEVIALTHQNRPVARGLSRSLQLDLSALDPLTSLCLDIWPDVVVNCAAISNPASVEAEPPLAEKINVTLPRHLAQLSNHIGARLIHISTDMVFDGRSEAPYRSTDMPLPVNLYGQTKLMSEREVLEHNPEDPLVLRIPILMGNSPGGQRSVHEKLIAAIQAGQRPKLFCDEIRQPASAENVAEVMLELSERRDLHGIFHWAGSETLSRFEIGQRILRHFGMDPEAIESASQTDAPGQAARPANLTFNLHPLVSKLKTRTQDFDEQLEELTRIDPLQT